MGVKLLTRTKLLETTNKQFKNVENREVNVYEIESDGNKYLGITYYDDNKKLHRIVTSRIVTTDPSDGLFVKVHTRNSIYKFLK